MNRFRKSTVIVFLFLVGTAFQFIGHAHRGDGPAAWKHDRPNEIAFERENKMVALPNDSESRTKKLPMGRWGGEHISMEVTERHTTIEYDCAHGRIDQRILLDRRGRFNVSGMHSPERGGPVRQGEQGAGNPVRFSGQVNGKTMKLSVRDSVTKELVGDFTLFYGAEPRLRKCM